MTTRRHAAGAWARAAPSFISNSSRLSAIIESCLRARPQPFQLSSPHFPLLGDAVGAVGQNIEFAIARQELDPDPRPGLLPGLREEVLLQSAQAALGRADEVLDRGIGPPASRPAPPRSGFRGPS